MTPKRTCHQLCPRRRFCARIDDSYQGQEVQYRQWSSFINWCDYLCQEEKHDTEARRVLDIKASIGVTVSDVQAKIQTGSLVVMSWCMWWSICCAEFEKSFGLLPRGRQQGPPRIPEEGKECVRVAWKISSPWWKVKPSTAVLTTTGDSAKRTRRKPGFGSCQSQFQKV